MPNKQTSKKHPQGFTLIETMVYIVIVSMFFVSMIQFTNSIVQSGQKSRTMHEVQQNARFAMERIKKEIRTAADLDTGNSDFDVNPGILTLIDADVLDSPTVFDVDAEGRLRMQEGGAAPIYLTSDDVKVTNLVFADRSHGRVKNVQIFLTIEYADASSVEYNTSMDLRSTVVIHSQQDL